MVTKHLTLHSKVLEFFAEIVREEEVPVHINILSEETDYDGSIQVDVHLECNNEEDMDRSLEALTKAINKTIEFFNNNIEQ